MAKLTKKVQNAISAGFQARLNGHQIGIMDIGSLSRRAEGLVIEGAEIEVAVGTAFAEFVASGKIVKVS